MFGLAKRDRSKPAPWLVVGLGNPGERYEHTRHNVGEDIVRQMAEEDSVRLGRLKSYGLTASLPAKNAVLAVPSGYMNTSGGPVSALTRYYSSEPARLIVIHDDLDLPVGSLRVKQGGGHGGHNGVADIAKALGTPEFFRVRIGIGRPPGRMDPAQFVLKRFSQAEQVEIELVSTRAIDAVWTLIEHGLEATQQQFHSPS